MTEHDPDQHPQEEQPAAETAQPASETDLATSADIIADLCPPQQAVPDSEAWLDDGDPSHYSARSWDREQLATLDPDAVRELRIGAGLTVVQEYLPATEGDAQTKGDTYVIIERQLAEDADDPLVPALEIIRLHDGADGRTSDRSVVSTDTARHFGPDLSPLNQRMLNGEEGDEVPQPGQPSEHPLTAKEWQALQNLIGNPYSPVVISETDAARIAANMGDAVKDNDDIQEVRAEVATTAEMADTMDTVIKSPLADALIEATKAGKNSVSYHLAPNMMHDTELEGRFDRIDIDFSESAIRPDTYIKEGVDLNVIFSKAVPDEPNLVQMRTVDMTRRTMLLKSGEGADIVGAPMTEAAGHTESQLSSRAVNLEEGMLSGVRRKPVAEDQINDKTAAEFAAAEAAGEQESGADKLQPTTELVTRGQLHDIRQVLKALGNTYPELSGDA